MMGCNNVLGGCRSGPWKLKCENTTYGCKIKGIWLK
jgi:hypothetical protein